MKTVKPGHVIIVEDEHAIAEILRDYLNKSGFRTTCVADGKQAVPTVKRDPPDVLLLDVMLPGKDGIEICREVRAFSTVPIIMVTAKAEEVDRLLGLEIGADDYICKPFSPREVVARVKAQYRRSLYGAKAAEDKQGFEIDEEKSCIRYNGERLDLTPTEFRIMKLLVSNAERVFSRSQLLELCYPLDQAAVDRAIDSHIKNLRKKLARACPMPDVIHAVYGMGYRFEYPDGTVS